MHRFKVTTFKWILSIFASFIFVWIVSYFFANSVALYDYDQQVNKYILQPNSIVRERSEGWARTEVGPYGTTGLFTDEYTDNPVLAIWGDSYIEGFNVSDQAKAGAVITRYCNKTEKCDYVGMNIGMSGRSIADYYFAIPEYEDVFPQIVHHYIVIANFNDILPDKESAYFARFVSSPELAMNKSTYKQTAPMLKQVLHTLKLDFVWHLAKKIYKKEFSFIPSFKQTERTDSSTARKSLSKIDKSWQFLLTKMAKITDKPLTFVYCPKVPVIDNNRIRFTDPDHDLAKKFENMCKSNGFGFINLKDAFIDCFNKYKKFPRGFCNSRPSQGHMNAKGHSILAYTILQQMSAEK